MNRSTPIAKAARMLDLVPYIQSRQGIALSELASVFNVGEEELLSDLQALWMCGENKFDLMDLEFESGFVSIRNAEVLNRVRTFSQQEVVCILLGLDLLRKDLVATSPEATRQIEELKVKIGAGTERLIDATSSISGTLHANIQKALQQRSALEIEYHSLGGDEVSLRTIEPLEEYLRDGNPLLMAYCHSAQARRSFRVDRIISAKVIEIPARAVDSNEQSHPAISAQLYVHSNRRAALESLGSYLSRTTDGYEVQAFSTAWLLRTVISLSGTVEVTTPPALRAEIASRSRSILALYGEQG